MGYQIITKMRYNAETKHIETWQHSSNVYPRTDEFYAKDVSSDEQMFEFIKFVATGAWQGRKWKKKFNILFREYPELQMETYINELRGKTWAEYSAICRKYDELAQSKYKEIVARFRQLTNIR